MGVRYGAACRKVEAARADSSASRLSVGSYSGDQFLALDYSDELGRELIVPCLAGFDPEEFNEVLDRIGRYKGRHAWIIEGHWEAAEEFADRTIRVHDVRRS